MASESVLGKGRGSDGDPGPVDLDDAVAQVLSDLRLQSGLTLEDLADQSGLHRTSLGLIEARKRRLTISSAQRLAAAFNLSLSELIREAEENLAAR